MLCSLWRSGDREGRLNTNRHQATKQQGATDVTGQLRIIVLDTSPTTRKILEVILQREGHQVACFDDPLEALRCSSAMALPTCSFSAWISLRWMVSMC